MKKKIIDILVGALFIVIALPSISGNIIVQETRMKEITSMYKTTYDDILFSDDFNDNIIDRNKWTEIYASGIWEETNGRAEFQLTESGGTETRFEGIESSPFEGCIGGDEPWENKLEVTWNMLPDIGSTSSGGEVTFRITDGRNWIAMGYDRLAGAACYSDSMGNSGEFIGGDEPWENKLEIYLDEYHVTMNSNSVTAHDSIFSSGTSTFNLHIYIEVGGTSRTLYLHSGFDDIIAKQITAENQPPSIPTITGPPSGKIKTTYDYTFNSIDSDGDDITYLIDWGDGNTDAGSGASNEEVTLKHAWNSQGNFNIKAKAKDVHGAESDWTSLEVSMPKNKPYINLLFLRFLENHPNIFPLLMQLLEFQ